MKEGEEGVAANRCRIGGKLQELRQWDVRVEMRVPL
jgi:hypothetical protein